MLSKETQKKLLKLLKNYSDDEIAAKVDSETEETVDIPQLKVFTSEEFETVSANIVKEKEAAIINKAKDFYAKDLKAKLGISKEGKDIEAVSAAIQEMIEAAKTPNGNNEWQTEKQGLVSQINEYKSKLSEKEREVENITWKTTLRSLLPENRNPVISDDEYLLLLENKLQRSKDGDTEVYSWEGQPLKDETYSPLPLKDALGKIWQTRQSWVKPQEKQEQNNKGKGFGDSQNIDTFKTLDEFQTHLGKKGIAIGSPEANKMLQDAVAKNPSLIPS